jgi:hypothetical protein
MGTLLFGLLLVVVGIAGRIFVGRRQFYRRNVAGVEEFQGYGSMLGSRFMEGGIRIVSVLIFIVGAVLAIAGYSRL